MKTTPWFPGTTLPARRGWYEVTCLHGMFGYPSGERIYWDGHDWFFDCRSMCPTDKCSFGQDCDKWRGLAKKP